MIVTVHSLKRNGTVAVTNQEVASATSNVIYDYINAHEMPADIVMKTSPAYETRNKVTATTGSPGTIATIISNVVYDYIDVHEMTTDIAMETSPAYQTNKKVRSTSGLQEPMTSLPCQ